MSLSDCVFGPCLHFEKVQNFNQAHQCVNKWQRFEKKTHSIFKLISLKEKRPANKSKKKLNEIKTGFAVQLFFIRMHIMRSLTIENTDSFHTIFLTYRIHQVKSNKGEKKNQIDKMERELEKKKSCTIYSRK